jgi:hypothetical protein
MRAGPRVGLDPVTLMTPVIALFLGHAVSEKAIGPRTPAWA